MKTLRYVLASLLIAGLTFAAAVPQKGAVRRVVCPFADSGVDPLVRAL